MVAQRYGRIVNTSSATMLGVKNSWDYPAAKGGVLGFTRSLAVTVPEGSAVRFRYCTASGHWFDDPEGDLEPNGYGQTHTVIAV